MDQSKPATAGASTEPTRHTGAVSVFIVDDHSGYRSVAAAVVAATPGFTFAGSAASSAEALATLDRLPSSPDLVLMDVNLDSESGIEVTRAILAVHPTAKVILVSTLRLDELPSGHDTCGADGYLSKMKLGTTSLARLWDGAYDWAP